MPDSWCPVPVREISFFRALRRLGGQSPYAETGEWQCVRGGDLKTADVGTDAHLRAMTCRVYHRSKTTALKHCIKLNRRSSK